MTSTTIRHRTQSKPVLRPRTLNVPLKHTIDSAEYRLRKPTLQGMAMAAVWVLGFMTLASIVLDHPIWQFH